MKLKYQTKIPSSQQKKILSKSDLLGSLFLFIFFINTQAQEVEIEFPLNANPVLLQKYYQYNDNNFSYKTAAPGDTLQLPFFDDFSYDYFYPNPKKWVDNFVFINRDYPIAPPTLGVATFDGLNQNGLPYNFLTTSNTSDLADYLTSKPINIGNPIFPADSVYLSFYYQAKGRGNEPESKDSLVLEFSTSSQNWIHVWNIEGYTPLSIDTGFHLVMIPITDTSFFKNGFRFRFKNYATLSGNLDHWHIDNVYLNKLRNRNDTLFNDVSFVYNSRSYLKNYSAMPWNHYQSIQMADSIPFFIRNNDAVNRTVSFKDSVKNDSGSLIWTHDGGICSLPPFETNGYDNCTNHAYMPISFSFPSLSDTATFTATGILNNTGDVNSSNDTLVYKQHFYDYYSYDDGTAESAYGLNVLGAQLAYRYQIYTTDTLRAIDLFFNPIINNASQYSFRLVVWNDNNGNPGALLHKDSIQYPRFGNINNFQRYNLDSLSNLVLTAGVYYFGLIQNTNTLLNIGMDKNNDKSQNLFYNIANSWQQSAISGALMLHPVFGNKQNTTGFSENNASQNQRRLNLFPNPTSGFLHIAEDQQKIIHQLFIYDNIGNLMLTIDVKNTYTIDVSTLSSGIYYIQAIGDEIVLSPQKLIITK